MTAHKGLRVQPGMTAHKGLRDRPGVTAHKGLPVLKARKVPPG